jgi:SAM-dependent methyltransferase
MTVQEVDQLVFAQRPTGSDHYDAEYFTGDWRAEGNNYSLETRRAIEARKPHLIKEVFAPRRVMDLGCGPGALMHLLWEIGVECDGIDFSESSKRLATFQVRDRIRIGSTTEALAPENAYDLVICREVMEHLTVLQVRQTVANIVRMTARFAYVTTRFHPAPASLLDVTTQFDVDPTHITLLNKDLLRVFFVLEGCRCRPDLEGRMDWAQKGRVLVYEKVPTEGRDAGSDAKTTTSRA